MEHTRVCNRVPSTRRNKHSFVAIKLCNFLTLDTLAFAYAAIFN